MKKSDDEWMSFALRQAELARDLDEVPVGALIVDAQDEIVAEAHNLRETAFDPTGHAELLAIASASKKLGRWRLAGCTLYVTLEPCLMCAGAIILSRLDRIVYGAKDPKAGAVSSLYHTLEDPRLNHQPTVSSGVLEDQCRHILKDFFAKKRARKSEPQG